ncbi:MAG: hypothetical protein H6719_36765 [Sandaracinaceae bacterium]|nr:hypothetical protein [Sandaracinaceae bacterium]
MNHHLLRIVSLAIVCAAPVAASAQASSRGVVLEPRLRGEDVDGVGHALDRILHSRLVVHGVFELAPTPALGLEDMQLAVGCVADTAECLGAVASQLEVSTLVHLDVERAGSELLLTLSVFHVGSAAPRTVTRRIGGEDAAARALDAIDPMVRDAFGLPPPDDEPEAAAAPADPWVSPDAAPPATATSSGGDVPIVPIVLLGAGAVALGVGFALGAVSQDSLSQYEATTIAGPTDVDVALGLYDRAQSEAIAADVLFGLGGALLAAGVVVWIIEAVSGGDEAVAVAPTFGPGLAGLHVSGRFGGAR